MSSGDRLDRRDSAKRVVACCGMSYADAMAKIVFALLGGAVIVIGSFFLSLKVFDYFGLFRSAPIVSLTVHGKDTFVSSGENYELAYSTSGAQSCEMTYRNADDGSSGHYTVTPNRSGTSGRSGLIGDYTLTCIGPDGATTSKNVRISRPLK